MKYMSAPSCPSGKRSYQRRGDARKALRRLQTMGLSSKSIYRCPLCGWLHLTKKPQ